MRIGNKNIVFRSVPALFVSLFLSLLALTATELMISNFDMLQSRSLFVLLICVGLVWAMFWMAWDVARDIFTVTNLVEK